MSEEKEIVSFECPADVMNDVRLIASITQRSENWVILQALHAYLLNDGQQLLDAIEAKERIARGEYEDFDDFVSNLEKIIQWNQKS